MQNGAKVCIVGAGAVGGYAAAMMSRSGVEVVAIDPWCEHVKTNGFTIQTAEESFVQTVETLHVGEVQSLRYRRFGIIFICVKMYDTSWATQLILPFLAPDGCIVTMQNGLMEPIVAAIAGEEAVLGCIASTLSTHLVAPGHIVRTRASGGATYDVFRVGEIDGAITPRAEAVASMLRHSDSARLTTDLFGERWAKLVANCMTTGISGVTGLGMREIYSDERLVDLMVQIAAEGIRLGNALGYPVESVRGLAPTIWEKAAAGDVGARAEVRRRLDTEMERITGENLSSTAQDIGKGRMTEVEFLNGFLQRKGEELALPVETNAKLAELIRRVERGEIPQCRDALFD